MTELDITTGMTQLSERGLITHNAAHSVRGVLPGEPNNAATLLLWSSFEVEPLVEPPTFETALRSRVANINDALRWLDELPDRSDRARTWLEARNIINKLTPADISVARLAVKEFAEPSQS